MTLPLSIEAQDDTGGDFIRALARGLRVIEAFGPEYRLLSLSTVAKKADISRASARRVLLTLKELGYVGMKDGEFYLKPRILRLGVSYITSQTIWSAARSVLEEVNEKTNESTSIATLDGGDIVYVARVRAKRLVGDNIGVGTRLPAHISAMGRVLLSEKDDEEIIEILKHIKGSSFSAYASAQSSLADQEETLRRIRKCNDRGYGTNDEEVEIGLRSIAVPIRNRAGKYVAAMNISAPASAISLTGMAERYLPILREAAQEIEDMFAHRATLEDGVKTVGR